LQRANLGGQARDVLAVGVEGKQAVVDQVLDFMGQGEQVEVGQEATRFLGRADDEAAARPSVRRRRRETRLEQQGAAQDEAQAKDEAEGPEGTGDERSRACSMAD